MEGKDKPSAAVAMRTHPPETSCYYEEKIYLRMNPSHKNSKPREGKCWISDDAETWVQPSPHLDDDMNPFTLFFQALLLSF